MPRNDRKTVVAREDLVLRLRNQRVPWQRIADSFDPPISLSQAQKDFRNALERRREETAESDDWLLEQEARNEEVARTAWDMIRRATQALRNDPALNSQLLFAIDRFLRTATAADDRIAELRGIRLDQRKRGEPTSVNLKSAADIVPLLEQGVSDALSIDDPDKRSRALLQAIRAAPEVLEKAGPQAQEEEGEVPRDCEAAINRALKEAEKIWDREAKKMQRIHHREMEIMVAAVKRGENIPEFAPLPPDDDEQADGEAE